MGIVGVVYRPMVETDYSAVFALWAGTPGVGMNEVDDSIEGIGRFLRRNPGLSQIAESDGRVIGAVLCGHDGRRGSYYHLTVDGEYRRVGVSAELLRRAEAALAAEGITKAALVVFKNNAAGAGFWNAAGYAVRNDLDYRGKFLR